MLSLSFDQYAAKLEATEQDGALAGEYRRGTRAPYSFKGRDGRVRAVHSGFPSPGSGPLYTKAERDVADQIERLLVERR